MLPIRFCSGGFRVPFVLDTDGCKRQRCAGIRGMTDLSLLDYPRVEAAARTALGEDSFTEAVARGRAVTTERVRALAAAV